MRRYAGISEDAPSSRATNHHRLHLGKLLIFAISILLFALAIGLMKEGAGRLTPLVRTHLAFEKSLHSLGFCWLFAYLIMSGSPVAAVALTFMDAGALSPLSAFMIITGSRFGTSFIVSLIGFIYVLRGRSRSASMSMGCSRSP